MILNLVEMVLVWLGGIALKKWPWVQNDLIPQLTLILSTVLEAVRRLAAPGVAEAFDVAVPAPIPPSITLSALINWAGATGLDWVVNKFIAKKIFGKKLY